MNVTISCTSKKDNRTIAYVLFEEGERYAEGIIPACVITRHKGFSEDELGQMEAYLRDNLAAIKEEAARINPIVSMIRDKK